MSIQEESVIAQANEMWFRSFPILDRQMPESDSELTKAFEELDSELSSGRKVCLHCRQGIGRTGLVAVGLLLTKGIDPATAIRQISTARGLPVPETVEQRHWIDRYAAQLATVQ